jgi:hypothetical protein
VLTIITGLEGRNGLFWGDKKTNVKKVILAKI